MVRGNSDHGLDINRLYGRIFVERHDPRMANIMSGEMDEESHHCLICEKTVTTACYWNLHFAYCCAVISEPTGHGKQQFRFCGVRFAVESPYGCGNHIYADGYNEFFKFAWKGKEHEIPAAIPHELEGFIYRDRGDGRKKRAEAQAKLQGGPGQIQLKSTAAEVLKFKQGAAELNSIMYSNRMPPRSSQATAHGLNGETKAKTSTTGIRGPSNIFGLLPLLSKSTQGLVANMAGIRLDSITETAPVKVVVKLAAKDEEDPENWKIWEKEKSKRNMEVQHARDAQKEEAGKTEETAARTKGRKQALAPSIRSFTRKSRHQKRTGTATQQP